MKGFVKYTDGGVLFAPTFVMAKNYKLFAEKHKEYTYPIDGWSWDDNFEYPDIDMLINSEAAITEELNSLLL